MKYIFLGGAGEVGASCLLIQVADRNILIDCGVRVNRKGIESLPDLELLKEHAPQLDAIFISHAHADHVGALPLVHQIYPNVTIYMTEATFALSTVMLQDAARLQNQNDDESLYTSEMVTQSLEAVKRLISVKEMQTWIRLWDDWAFKCIASGHILGAISIVLRTPEGMFLYSGDVSAFHQRTVNGTSDLSGINPDFMWCEATYGEGNHPSRTTEEQKLAKAVARIIENGGSVLIPSFALGRAQEIIFILKTAMQSGTISRFRVFTDGLVNAICDIYKQFSRFGSRSMHNLRRNQDEIFFTRYVQQVMPGARENIIKDMRPKCIIASSGMLTGGASVEYAKALAGNAKNAIFLSGYQDAESPGRRLQELCQGDALRFADGSTVEVKCQVKRFHLSAHSDQGQLINMIKEANPKAIALGHGEHNTIQALREKLFKNHLVICPPNGKLYEGVADPDWLPAHVRAKIDAKAPIHLSATVSEDGVIKLLLDDPDGEHWKRFSRGTVYKVTLKGKRLVITNDNEK